MEWYYAEDGQKRGPFSEPQLYSLRDSGRVQDDTLVWRTGAAGWRRFSDRYTENPPADLKATWQGDRSSMPFAGFWIRVCANFIDTVTLGSVLVLAALLFGPSLFYSSQRSVDVSTLQRSIGPLFCLVVIASSIAYQAISVAIWGGTLGKLALRLRVICSDGTPLTAGRSVARAVAFLVDVMVPFSLGFIIAGFDSEKRTLHDYMAGTRVIHKPANAVPWL